MLFDFVTLERHRFDFHNKTDTLERLMKCYVSRSVFALYPEGSDDDTWLWESELLPMSLF